MLFRAPGFPTVDAPAIDDSVVDAAFSGLPVDRFVRPRDAIAARGDARANGVERVGLHRVRGLMQENVRRAEKPSVAALSGAVWHEPLALELGRDREPLVKLLETALTAARVPTSPGDWGVASRALLAPRSILIVVVNERAERVVRRIYADGKAFDVPVRPLGARLVLVERATGRILASTPGESVVPFSAPAAQR